MGEPFRHPSAPRIKPHPSGAPAGPPRPAGARAAWGRRAGAICGWRLVALIALSTAFPVHAEIAFGVRGGYEDVAGDAFAGSGRIGGTPFFGLQAIFPVVPFASLVLAGEQRTKRLDLDSVTWGGQELGGRATWTDQTLLAAVRLGMPGVVGLYGGGGVGMHRREADLSDITILTGEKREPASPKEQSRRARERDRPPAGDPLGEFVDDAEAETVHVAWHALVGVELRFPLARVTAFAEGRIDDLQARPPHSVAAYAGVNVRLP